MPYTRSRLIGAAGRCARRSRAGAALAVTQGRSGSPADRDRAVDHVLGHLAVGRPLAAGDGDQARRRETTIVWSRESAAVARAVAGLHQRTQAGEDAQHVAGDGGRAQVARGVRQEELDLLRQRRAARARLRGTGVSVVPTTSARATASRTARGRRRSAGP